MEVIRAVIQKCASSSRLKIMGTVMNAVAGSFETNMPQEQIAASGENAAFGYGSMDCEFIYDWWYKYVCRDIFYAGTGTLCN